MFLTKPTIAFIILILIFIITVFILLLSFTCQYTDYKTDLRSRNMIKTINVPSRHIDKTLQIMLYPSSKPPLAWEKKYLSSLIILPCDNSLAYALFSPWNNTREAGKIWEPTLLISVGRFPGMLIKEHKPNTQIFLSCNLQ